MAWRHGFEFVISSERFAFENNQQDHKIICSDIQGEQYIQEYHERHLSQSPTSIPLPASIFCSFKRQ